MSEPRPRVHSGRESRDAATNRIISAARSHRTIPAAELSAPAVNATGSMGRKQVRHDHLHEQRARLISMTTPSSEAQVSSLEAEIATPEPINAKLKAKIATLESMNAKLKVENQKFEVTTSQLKGANDRLKSEIYKINSEGDRLKENIHKLNGENSKLMDKNRKLNDEKDKLRNDNDKLRNNNDKLRKDNALPKDKNIKLNEDSEEFKGDNCKLKDKNDSLESQLCCHDDLIRSLKDEISEREATLNSSRDFAHEVIMSFLTSGYNLPDGLPDHLNATYENAMELSKSITKALGPKKLPKHDAGPGSSMSPTLSGKSTDNGNGRVRKGSLLAELTAKRRKRVHDPQGTSQSAGNGFLRTTDLAMDDETSLHSFHFDIADDDDEEV